MTSKIHIAVAKPVRNRGDGAKDERFTNSNVHPALRRVRKGDGGSGFVSTFDPAAVRLLGA